MRIVRIDRQAAKAPAHPEWFPGTVWQQFLNEPDTPGGTEVIAVWFEEGSRTKPHVHPVDQLLQVVEGEGVVDIEGERRRIRAGDWVVVPAGVWHWHGATPDTAMCHLSIKQPGDTDWSSEWRRLRHVHGGSGMTTGTDLGCHIRHGPRATGAFARDTLIAGGGTGWPRELAPSDAARPCPVAASRSTKRGETRSARSSSTRTTP